MKEDIGLMIDRIDNLLAATRLQVEPRIHVDGLKHGLELLKSDLQRVLEMRRGEWSDLYIVALDRERETIQVAGLSELGEAYAQDGEDDEGYWSDWSEPMTLPELAEWAELRLKERIEND
jgi:hypothetical protein